MLSCVAEGSVASIRCCHSSSLSSSWPRRTEGWSQSLPAPGCLQQVLGSGRCCPHRKTPAHLALQVHGLNAAPAVGLGLCPASSRVRRASCSAELLLVILSDTVLPGKGNDPLSELFPLPPLPAPAWPYHGLGGGSSSCRCATLLFPCRTPEFFSLEAAGGSPSPRAAFPGAALGLCPAFPLPGSFVHAVFAFSCSWVMAETFGQGYSGSQVSP